MARNNIEPVIANSTNPAIVQGRILESICETGTLVKEMPKSRKSTIAMVPTNSMMDITWVDSVIAYIYSDSCSAMLQGVSASLVTSSSSIDSPLVIYQPCLPLIKDGNLRVQRKLYCNNSYLKRL